MKISVSFKSPLGLWGHLGYGMGHKIDKCISIIVSLVP